MDDEERERQLDFDRKRLKRHRAVVALAEAARADYDRAATEAALTKARAEASHRFEEIRKRVTDLDHWGNNSRLLADYAALEQSLSTDYPDARLSALKGDATALKTVQSAFDQHLKTIADWLEEAERGEDEE